MSALILVVIPLALLLPAMGLLSRMNSSHIVVQELKRKALHISVGLTALSFPLFLNERWMIITALGLVVAGPGSELRRNSGHDSSVTYLL